MEAQEEKKAQRLKALDNYLSWNEQYEMLLAQKQELKVKIERARDNRTIHSVGVNNDFGLKDPFVHTWRGDVYLFKLRSGLFFSEPIQSAD